MFDVGRSMFDVHQFLFRSNWPPFRTAAGLTPETKMAHWAAHRLKFKEQGCQQHTDDRHHNGERDSGMVDGPLQPDSLFGYACREGAEPLRIPFHCDIRGKKHRPLP
jgi:hypothetical protein